MLSLGLSVGEQTAFHRLLVSHHTIDVRLQILDLDHKFVGDVSDRLIDGQVTVDADAEITRGLDLDILDPDGGIQLDTGSPNDGALFADRMIRVLRKTVHPLGNVSYSTPIFTGPLTKLERSGVLLKIECQGKESMGLSQAWKEKTFKKGTRVTSAIRTILTELMGENQLAIPNKSAKLPKNIHVGGDKLPWAVAKQLAASIGYQLYYDGNGTARMRKKPNSVCYTFKEGVNVKSEPDVGFDIGNVVNAVEVWGKKPKKGKDKKAKKRPHARVVAPRSHPLSPWKLGRSGGPRYLPLVIEDDSIRTNAAAKRRAKLELKRRLLESVDVAYDTLVVPHLEELDVVKLETSKFAAHHVARKFVVPLTAAGDGSMGYVKNVKPNSRAIRAKRTSRKSNERNRR